MVKGMFEHESISSEHRLCIPGLEQSEVITECLIGIR